MVSKVRRDIPDDVRTYAETLPADALETTISGRRAAPHYVY
ncbi:MAG TPA: hypothetical protein VFR27_10485 [Mycobacterium sp.]|nr:hypothetical protein [Mycobacterium sp.]